MPTSTGARRWLGDGAWLLAGSTVNGATAYAYLALGTREYGATDFASVSVLWSLWAVTGAAVVFPIQHEVTRRLESGRGEAPVRAALGPLALVIGVLSVATTLVTWALADPLFGTDGVLDPVMAGVIVCGAGLTGFVRGTLAGRRRFVSTGVAIGAENVVRLAGAAVVLAAGWQVGAYTLTLALGPVTMLAWAATLRLGNDGEVRDDERGLAGARRGFASLAGASVISQVVLTSAPVLLAVTGGARATVTSLFSALALLRAPYLLLLGLTARITGALTRAVVSHDAARLRRARARIVQSAVALAVVFAVSAMWAGDLALELLFGPTVDLDATDFAILGAGTGLAMGTILLVLLLMARGEATGALRAWVAALVPAAVVLLIAPSGEVGGVVAAFAVAECAALALLVLADTRAAATDGTS